MSVHRAVSLWPWLFSCLLAMTAFSGCDDESTSNADNEGQDDATVDMSADAGEDTGQADGQLGDSLTDTGPTCSETEYVCPGGCCAWNPTLAFTASVSSDLSLAVGPNGPVVTYREDDQVQIARGASGSLWTTETFATPQLVKQISEVMLDDAGYPRLGLVRWWDEAADLAPFWRDQVYYLEESASGWSETLVAGDYSAALVWMALDPDGAPVVSVFARDAANGTNTLATYTGSDGGELSWNPTATAGFQAGYMSSIWNEYDMAIAPDGSHHHMQMGGSSSRYWTNGMLNSETLSRRGITAALEADADSAVHALIRDSDGVLRHYVRLGDDLWSSEDLAEVGNQRAYSIRQSAQTADDLAYCYAATDNVTFTLWAGFHTADGWFHLPPIQSDAYTVCDVAHDADGNPHMVVYDSEQGGLVHGIMGR